MQRARSGWGRLPAERKVRHHPYRTLNTSLEIPTMESRNVAEPLPKAGSGTALHAETVAVRFAEFVFDLRRGELKGIDSTRIPLRPKTEALLRTLLASPGLLLSREALMQAVWPLHGGDGRLACAMHR